MSIKSVKIPNIVLKRHRVGESTNSGNDNSFVPVNIMIFSSKLTFLLDDGRRNKEPSYQFILYGDGEGTVGQI